MSMHDFESFWFQQRVARWVKKYLGERSSQDAQERNLRFLEEAVELVQARGTSQAKAHELIDYVYSRPKGNQEQEVGGVVITLAALCNQAGILITDAAYKELERIEQPEVGEKVKARQKTKPADVRSPDNGEGDELLAQPEAITADNRQQENPVPPLDTARDEQPTEAA